MEIGKITFCGRTHVCGRTDTAEFKSIKSSPGHDLKIQATHNKTRHHDFAPVLPPGDSL